VPVPLDGGAVVGCGVAVDEDHVVAFAEPTFLILEDCVGDADEVAAADGLHEDVVVFAVEVFEVVDALVPVDLPVVDDAFAGGGLTVLGVEAA